MDIILPIKELRERHGYKTRPAFAAALKVDYSVVKSWERKNKPVLPRLDNLLAMCNLFDCDLDYLTGKIEQHTHAIKTVCETTGLSEKAVNRLRKYAKCETAGTKALSHLIESDTFYELIESYITFLEQLNKLNSREPHQVGFVSITRPRERADGKMVMNIDDAVHYYMDRASAALRNICESDYRKKVKELHKISQPIDRDYALSVIDANNQEICFLSDENEYIRTKLLPDLADTQN